MRPARQVAVSLVAVVALVASPSVVAACAALCGTGGGHAGHRAAVVAAAVAASIPDAAEPAHHHHHEDMAPAGALADPMPAAGTGAHLSDGRCCEHAGRTLPSLAAAVRFDVGVAPALTADVAPVLSQPASGHLAAARGAPSPPLLAPRTPRVLRI